jgi:pilus assembly protein Flp/PilA
MLAYLRKVSRHARDRGASAVEYGLLVAAIAAVIVGVVFALGGLINGAFKKTCTAVATAPNAPVGDGGSCPP